MIQLRPVTNIDINDIHQLHLFPETDRYNTLGIPENIQQTEEVFAVWFADINRAVKHVFIIEDEKGNFVGVIGMNLGKPNYLRSEIWYKLRPGYWGKGYATAAVKLILDFGFTTLKLHRIEAGCATENIASIKVLEKSGFIKEGISRKNLPIRGEWKDNFNFGILEEDWLQTRK